MNLSLSLLKIPQPLSNLTEIFSLSFFDLLSITNQVHLFTVMHFAYNITSFLLQITVLFMFGCSLHIVT